MEFLKKLFQPKPIVIGAVYRHVERDPHDMIDYVVPQRIEENTVYYIKHYKQNVIPETPDEASITEFNFYYRKEG